MLQVRQITKWFGDDLILDRVSFTLNRGQRAGLIGPNGCGKSTLLKIITGELAADSGQVRLSPVTLRLGYLPQALDFPPDATVGGVLATAAGERTATDAQLAVAAERLAAAQGAEMAMALAQYQDALSALEALGAASLPAEAVLDGLGLGDVGLDRPVHALSGGQKTRLGLARLLFSEPDVLVLDEPTNHLDIAALAWLEDFLAGYRGVVLLVSHDRTLLDRTVSAILALDDATHTLREYAGTYSDYAAAVDRDLEKQWATYHEQQERVARLSSSIRRLAGQAQNIENETVHFHWRRIAKDLARRSVVQKKRLERLLASEDAVEKPGQTWKMKLEFPDTPRSGEDVLSIEDLSVGYGSRPVLEHVHASMRQGERVALIGPNGAGKTTLLRCITGELTPWSGACRLGRGVRLGYMAQEQETLAPDATPLALLRAAAPLTETDARSFLHYFLFAGDEVFTAVGKLSFGERSRLALALLAARGCNFLLLDEPINHLDIPSRESFERAMTRFEGTVLAVVHDRTFIERFATTLWIVAGGAVQAINSG